MAEPTLLVRHGIQSSYSTLLRPVINSYHNACDDFLYLVSIK